jgi:hypothetical protein
MCVSGIVDLMGERTDVQNVARSAHLSVITEDVTDRVHACVRVNMRFL